MAKPKKSKARPKAAGYSFPTMPATAGASTPAPKAGGRRVKLQGDCTAEELALLNALCAVVGETAGALLMRGLVRIYEELPAATRAEVDTVKAAALTLQRASRR